MKIKNLLRRVNTKALAKLKIKESSSKIKFARIKIKLTRRATLCKKYNLYKAPIENFHRFNPIKRYSTGDHIQINV